MSEEHHYTGRLWVLPFSREYEFRFDDGHRVSGSIDNEYFITEQLCALFAGERYMCEFDRDPRAHRMPRLVYVRTEKGEPISFATAMLHKMFRKKPCQCGQPHCRECGEP
jgi:hypothetical protein